MKGLLEGVRVVEAAVLLTGDYLGMLLADEGADVVKVETPGLGDWIRDHMGEVVPRYSPYHLFVNRNKRSITADLKSPLGRDIVHRLVADADVVVTGFTGTVPERLGIGYEQLRAIKPDLVYCQATGFGADGPYASLPSHGEMMQALVASPRREVGPDGHPMIAKDDQTASPPEGVVVGPLYAAYGVASALFRRERTGEGCYLDVACSDAVLAATYPTALFPLNEGRYSKHAMHPHTEGRVAARYTYYRTKEGKHLLFCPEEPKFWSRFCRAIGRSDLDVVADTAVTTDYGDGDIALYDELQRVFLTRTLDEWVQLFLDHKIPGGPALPVEEAQYDPHVRFRQMIVDEKHPVAGPFTTLGNPIRVPRRDFVIRHPAPALGEHTDEVLREIGYSADELEELRSLDAV